MSTSADREDRVAAPPECPDDAEAGATRVTRLTDAIYGTILALSVVAVGSAYQGAEAGIAASVLATGIVFWIAHAYAHTVAGGIARGRRPGLRDVRHELFVDWPIVQSAVPVAIALFLGTIGVFGYSTSVTLALVIGVVALAGWGAVIARAEGRGILGTIILAGINATFGLLIVLLKTLVH